MSTINDEILRVTGGPTINDGLSAFFGRTDSEALPDAEYRYLQELGATATQRNDMWFEVLRAAGYTGALNDMLFQFWSADAAAVSVPDVVGLTQVAATAAITGAGLVLGTVTGTVDPVISQSPVAATIVALGSSVDITLTA